MSKRDWTDAEFEIVKPAPVSRRHEPWNGLGLPPEWPIWGWIERGIFVVVRIATLLGVIALAYWLKTR